jgi:hypothetical protein
MGRRHRSSTELGTSSGELDLDIDVVGGLIGEVIELRATQLQRPAPPMNLVPGHANHDRDLPTMAEGHIGNLNSY